jgi:hypothetical protein
VAKRTTNGGFDQIADLFRTTDKTKTQQVVNNRGHKCGDIELPGYLANSAGPVSLVLDFLIVHERWGSSSDPTLTGLLHYPNDIDRSLNESVDDKIRKYHTDYNNNPPTTIVFMSSIVSTSWRLHSEFVCLLFLQRLGGTSGLASNPANTQITCSSGVRSPRIFFSIFSIFLSLKT